MAEKEKSFFKNMLSSSSDVSMKRSVAVFLVVILSVAYLLSGLFSFTFSDTLSEIFAWLIVACIGGTGVDKYFEARYGAKVNKDSDANQTPT